MWQNDLQTAGTGAHESRRSMSDTTCTDCNLEMVQVEKTTFTGRDMREYQCPKCKRTQIVDCGKASWQILHDAQEDPDNK
jgi:ssDNA-binding Zn-finger/Zn-ribbon topoisomerase 1